MRYFKFELFCPQAVTKSWAFKTEDWIVLEDLYKYCYWLAEDEVLKWCPKKEDTKAWNWFWDNFKTSGGEINEKEYNKMKKSVESKERKYVHFTYHAPYCGCDEEEWVAFLPSFPEENIADWAEEGAQLNGESWESLVWDEIDEDYTEKETDQVFDFYWSEVSGCWEYCTKEEWEENDGYDATR